MKKFQIGQQQFHPKNVLATIDKTIVELEKIRYYVSHMEQDRENILPKCKQCGIRNVRMRQDETYFCYSCGYDSKKYKK